MDHSLGFMRYAEWLKDGNDRIEWVQSEWSFKNFLVLNAKVGLNLSIYFPHDEYPPTSPHGQYDVFARMQRLKTFDPANPNALKDAKAFCENWYRKWKLTQLLGEELK